MAGTAVRDLSFRSVFTAILTAFCRRITGTRRMHHVDGPFSSRLEAPVEETDEKGNKHRSMRNRGMEDGELRKEPRLFHGRKR
jgi:hypothetical protein